MSVTTEGATRRVTGLACVMASDVTGLACVMASVRQIVKLSVPLFCLKMHTSSVFYFVMLIKATCPNLTMA